VRFIYVGKEGNESSGRRSIGAYRFPFNFDGPTNGYLELGTADDRCQSRS